MDAWQMTDNERTAFADLTDSLTPAQWDQLSLCTGWRVRDVVGHVADTDPNLGKALLTLARYGFRLNTMIDREAKRLGSQATDQLSRDLRTTVGIHKAVGGKGEDMVMETIVHQQDVRRPLGIAREYPADEMKVALDRAAGMGNSLVPGKKRIKDLRLRATDLDWEHGDGAEVTGPAEALLMAMAGRTQALSDLSGPGLDTLRKRIGG